MNKIPNGGFPLLQYCKNDNQDKQNKELKKIEKKQYFFASKNNINIRNILKKNHKEFIKVENNEDIIEEINEL